MNDDLELAIEEEEEKERPVEFNMNFKKE